MPTVSINGAAQVLRPPEDGLPYLRLDRAREMTVSAGSVALDGGQIAAFERNGEAEEQVDASGCAVIPGFVDCHTHLPFAGWRAAEYEQKITGVSYEEIARSGGGIRSSARAWAEASDKEILYQGVKLAREMLRHGTTTLEGKTGYGLSLEQEQRALELGGKFRWAVEETQEFHSTALLAHSVPDGYDADSWMDAVAEALPELLEAGCASALDIYVESVAFSNQHLRRMGELAAQNGLDLRAHVEQFNDNGSVPVALELGARSVDHLACLPEEGVSALAASETAAVLLPGAEFMGDERLAPGRALADAGAIGVLGTDFNPGTSPINSLPLIIGLAVRRYRWSVREALAAATLNGAWVLRCSDQTGSLEVGKRGDVLLLDGPIESLPYRFGHNPVAVVYQGGDLAWVRDDQWWRLER
jgi:imidazolonepropionase